MYVGADVHSKSTSLAVLDSSGRLVTECVLTTQPEHLVGFVTGLPGEVWLTFEEGTYAAWLHELLLPHVAKLVVCHPGHNKLICSGDNKTDRIDAHKLAELLRGDYLKPVYHAVHDTVELRELGAAYRKLVADRTRTKNRLKALYRSFGIATPGDACYDLEQCQAWLDQLPRRSLQLRACWTYRQLALLDDLVAEAGRELAKEAKKHEAYKLLRTVPGIGKTRAALIVGQVQTPHRFRTRKQLWAYCGFSVRTFNSSDYDVVDGGLRKKRVTRTRGLTHSFNRTLKEVFKGAAFDVAHRGPFKEEFKRRIAQGQEAEHIKLTFARRIAATCLAIWKKGEPYDPNMSATAQARDVPKRPAVR